MIPRRLPAALLSLLIAVAVTPLNAEEARPAIKTEESEARLKRDVYFLASDECEGRGPGTAGQRVIPGTSHDGGEPAESSPAVGAWSAVTACVPGTAPDAPRRHQAGQGASGS